MDPPSSWFGTLALAAGLAFAVPSVAQTVHPAAEAVPANLLRVSISFDTPQRAALGSEVRLTKRDGGAIDRAFYPQPLWSPDRRVLTLHLDPGRVKTGLVARGAMGPVLTPGETVQVRIGDRVLCSWSVTAARRVTLQPLLAAVRAPRAGTRDPFTLPFASAVDWQGRDLIAIEGPDRSRLKGESTLVDGERIWTFSPENPWRAGAYVLRLHPDLEDPQGNRVDQAFEARSGAADGDPKETKHVFTVGRARRPSKAW